MDRHKETGSTAQEEALVIERNMGNSSLQISRSKNRDYE